MKYQYIKPPQQLDAVLDLVPSVTSSDVLHNDLALMQTDLGLSVVYILSENLSDRSGLSSDTLFLDGARVYLPSGELALIITEIDLLFSNIDRNPRDSVEALNTSRFGTIEDDVFNIVGNLLQSSLLSLGVRDTTEFVDGKEGVDTIKIDRDYVSGDFKLQKVDESTFVMNAPKYLVNPMTVKNVEQIEFNNTLVVLSEIVALDIDGIAGKAYRLYQAAFGRKPDKGGFEYWVSTMDLGHHSLEAVAGGFIASAEFQSLYGDNPSNEEFVTKLYDNVSGRAPEQGGFDYWVGLLKDQKISKVSTLINFSESDENQLNVIGVIENGIELFL